MDKWEAATNEAIAGFKMKMGAPPAQEFWAACDKLFYQGSYENVVYLADYIREYIDKIKSVRSANTVKKYITTLNKLEEYERQIKRHFIFQDININFYIKFSDMDIRSRLLCKLFRFFD